MNTETDKAPRTRGIVKNSALKALTIALLLIGGIGVLPGRGIGETDAQSLTQVASPASESDLSVADVAAIANPAVVTITSARQLSTESRPGPSRGQQFPDATEEAIGSGVIIDNDGHVLTNSHVVADAGSVTVQFFDGTEVGANVVGSDPFQDIAVLQLDLSNGAELPGVLAVGSTGSVRAGDSVVAIGSSLGELTNTVSTGIVGAVHRSLDTGNGYELGHLVQHDAAIFPGNSGGPLLNMKGEVIGINVAASTRALQYGNDSVGFAIEIDPAMEIARQLIDHGSVTRPYIGISARATPDGQLVEQVAAEGPAKDVDLQVGDLIAALDGEPINTDHPLINQLFEYEPSDEVTLTVIRNGSTHQVTLTLGTRPADS